MKFDFNIEDIALEDEINPNLNAFQLNPEILKIDETFNDLLDNRTNDLNFYSIYDETQQTNEEAKNLSK